MCPTKKLVFGNCACLNPTYSCSISVAQILVCIAKILKTAPSSLLLNLTRRKCLHFCILFLISFRPLSMGACLPILTLSLFPHLSIHPDASLSLSIQHPSVVDGSICVYFLFPALERYERNVKMIYHRRPGIFVSTPLDVVCNFSRCASSSASCVNTFFFVSSNVCNLLSSLFFAKGDKKKTKSVSVRFHLQIWQSGDN